jgi:predicted esterase
MRILLILVALSLTARAADLPYAAGRTETTLEGLKTAILVPEGLDAKDAKKCSMIVLLHGLGDSGINLSHSLADRPAAGYLVVAPSTRARAWDKADVDATIRIAEHMLKVMPVDPEKIHVMGFSNGGWNLGPLAFHEKLKPKSATYLAAGYSTGSASKWAKKNLGVLALAGAQDGNAKSALATVTALMGKVRSVEARLQPNLAHKWPRELIPYQKWWMGTREGRYVPGKDMNFKWREDVDEALAEIAARKGRGGVLLYVYGEKDTAAHVQNDVMMDPKVRFFGNQNPCVKLDRESVDAKFEIKETPTLIVIGKDGKIKKTLAGKSIKAKSLASALKKIAPIRKKG